MPPSDPPPEPQPPSPPADESQPASGWLEAGSGWRRQHPAACFFAMLQTVRAMIIPIIFGVLAARGTFLFVFFGFILAFSIGGALLRYWRYRYRFTEHELVVEQGWLYRQVRHISYIRIQNINTTRNVFHRMFRVSGLQLESASGSEPEAVMDALSNAAIDELQERIEKAKSRTSDTTETSSEAGAESPPPAPRRQVLRLGLGELVLHGLISNRGMVLVAAAIGFLMQGPLGERILPRVWDWVQRHAERLPVEVLEALGPVIWFALVVAVFLIVLGLLAALSVIYAIFRFYGFSLKTDAKTVRAEFGLLTRVAITIPRDRIQLIGFRANPFHRLLGRLSVRVETAGVTGSEENPSSLRWLAPILKEAEAPKILSEVQPEVDWGEFEWRPLHPRTRARIIRVRLIFLGIATILLGFTAGALGFIALVLVPLILAYARGYFRYAAWTVTDTAIGFRSGWLVRQQSFVRYKKIQTVTLSRNPFDRRWGMATVGVDTAGADPAGHGVTIRFLDYESARQLRDFLEDKTRQTEFVW